MTHFQQLRVGERRWFKRKTHNRRKKLCYITSEVSGPHVRPRGVCILKEWDLLWAHSTAYKLEDYPGPSCGFSARCGQVYGRLCESECLSAGRRWGERQSIYTVLKCVNNLVCHTAPRGVKVWGRGGLLRAASVMLTCSFLNSTCPQGFMGFTVTDLLTWFYESI